jgi:anaerobic selenocysteine-containing dehydrogenase
LRQLAQEDLSHEGYAFILMAGERRSYNANQIYRNPAWRKTDRHGAMRMHPEDAQELNLTNGSAVLCQSANGSIEAFIETDESVRRKMVTLPNGYGLKYKDGAPIGPQLNRLTPSHHCEPFTKTPFHKYLPVNITKQA